MLELWPIFLRVAAIRFLILSKFRPFSLPIQSWFKLPDYTLVEEKLGGTGAQPAEDVPKHQLGSGICFMVSRGSRPKNFGRPPLEAGRMPRGNRHGPCWHSSWTPQGHLRTTLGWMGWTSGDATGWFWLTFQLWLLEEIHDMETVSLHDVCLRGSQGSIFDMGETLDMDHTRGAMDIPFGSTVWLENDWRAGM